MSTWQEVVPGVFGSCDEVAFKIDFILRGHIVAGEFEVIGVWEDRPMDTADAFIALG